jgi:hypothetical protein
MIEFVGRNKAKSKCKVKVYGKECNLKQFLILQAAIFSLYDSTNFYASYKEMYSRYSCMITLENDRYLIRFLLPDYVDSTEAKIRVLWFALRKIAPMEMLLFLLENSADILVKTSGGEFKISPPDGGDLVININSEVSSEESEVA